MDLCMGVVLCPHAWLRATCHVSKTRCLLKWLLQQECVWKNLKQPYWVIVYTLNSSFANNSFFKGRGCLHIDTYICYPAGVECRVMEDLPTMHEAVDSSSVHFSYHSTSPPCLGCRWSAFCLQISLIRASTYWNCVMCGLLWLLSFC